MLRPSARVVTAPPTPAAPPTCTDSVKNQTESDVDCGGSCTPCSDGKECSAGTDCISNVCDNGLCVAATCTD